ncbi:MAG: hemerythrin domain-containing protein [Actinomycetota bacterium]|jgi:hemerythrin-like domain-containing protein
MVDEVEHGRGPGPGRDLRCEAPDPACGAPIGVEQRVHGHDLGAVLAFGNLAPVTGLGSSLRTRAQHREGGSVVASEVNTRSTDDIVEVVRQEHDRLRALLDEISDAAVPLQQAAAVLTNASDALAAALMVHETAEEAVVYRVLKVHLEAANIADPRLSEEDELKRLLARLERLTDALADYPALLGRFETLLRAHLTQEEARVFPLLEERLTSEQRQEMAGDFRAVEVSAPHHPHPHAPESAPGNLLLAPVLAAIDRFRDRRRRRHQR